MNKDKVLYAIVGFVLGVLVTWLFASFAINDDHAGIVRLMGLQPEYYRGGVDNDSR